LIGVAGPRQPRQTGQPAAPPPAVQAVGRDPQEALFPDLGESLTFLDDKLLPSTSNAVERGNRRYRKMQKHVYRVRTQEQIEARLALDMWREAKAKGVIKQSRLYMSTCRMNAPGSFTIVSGLT